MASDFVIPAATNVLREARENSPLIGFREPTGNPMLYRQVAANARTIGAYQTALQQLNARISRCERRAGIIEDNTQGVVAMPFSIYPALVAAGACVANVPGTGYTGSYPIGPGDVLTVEGGTITDGGTPMQVTVVMVDKAGGILSARVSQAGSYSTPPTWPASVTGGTGSGARITALTQANDGWSVFGIRSGQIAVRPTCALADWEDHSSPYGVVCENSLSGNNEFVCQIDLDGNINEQLDYAGTGEYYSGSGYDTISETAVVLNGVTEGLGTPKLIYGFLFDGSAGTASTFVQYNQIVFPAAADLPDYATGAAIYAEIIDDTVTKQCFSVNIYAVLFGDGNPIEDVVTPGPNIIMIALAFPKSTSGAGIGWDVTQFQLGNLVNRWPAMVSNPTGGAAGRRGMMGTFRGYWVADSLSGKAFYDGDWIIDDTAVNGTITIWGNSTNNPSGGLLDTQIGFTSSLIFVGGYIPYVDTLEYFVEFAASVGYITQPAPP
jgi:hypothetical protein